MFSTGRFQEIQQFVTCYIQANIQAKQHFIGFAIQAWLYVHMSVFATTLFKYWWFLHVSQLL